MNNLYLMKKPNFEVDKIRCTATNGKFELVVNRSSCQTCKVVDASNCHPHSLSVCLCKIKNGDNLISWQIKGSLWF